MTIITPLWGAVIIIGAGLIAYAVWRWFRIGAQCPYCGLKTQRCDFFDPNCPRFIQRHGPKP